MHLTYICSILRVPYIEIGCWKPLWPIESRFGGPESQAIGLTAFHPCGSVVVVQKLSSVLFHEAGSPKKLARNIDCNIGNNAATNFLQLH